MEPTIYVLIESDDWSRLVFCPPLIDGAIARNSYSIERDPHGDFALMEADICASVHGYKVSGPYMFVNPAQDSSAS